MVLTMASPQSPSVLFLLRPLMQSVRNQVRTASRGDLLRLAQALALGLVIWAGIAWVGSRMFEAFLRYPSMAEALLTKTLGTTLAAGLGITVLASTVCALGVMYSGRDVRALLAAPVDGLVLFLAQLLQTTFQGSLAGALVLAPFILSAGWAWDAGWEYYATVVFGGACLLVGSASWGAVIAWTIARFGGGPRASRVLVGVAIVGILISLPSLRTLLPVQLVLDSEQASTVAMVDLLQTKPGTWLPSDWMARALVRGVGGLDIWGLGALLGFAWGSVTLAAVLYAHAYRSAIAVMGGSPGPRSVAGAGRLSDRLSRWAEKRMGPGATQVLLKEARRLARETREWGHWLLAVMGGGVYVMALASVPPAQGDALSEFLVHLLVLMNVGVGGLLLASVGTHTVLPAVHRERPGLWLLGSAPPRWHAIVRVKYAVHLCVLAPLAVGLCAVSGAVLGASPSTLALSAAATLSQAACLVALGLWFGARFPQFGARSSASLAASPSAIGFLLSGLSLVALFTVGMAPAILPLDLARQAGVAVPAWLPTTGPLMVALAGLSLTLPLLGAFWLVRGAAAAVRDSVQGGKALLRGGAGPAS